MNILLVVTILDIKFDMNIMCNVLDINLSCPRLRKDDWHSNVNFTQIIKLLRNLILKGFFDFITRYATSVNFQKEQSHPLTNSISVLMRLL